MHGLLEMAFVSEIVLQTKIAIKASERLQVANKNLDNIEVWGAIQSILVATGNVSKIIWPSAKTDKPRGEMLRKILKVEENNLLSERKFRNHFEHYDSRLEDFFKKQSNGSINYIDLAMNPSLSGHGLENTHRGYNAFNNTLLYRGDSLDINELTKALEDIHEACKRYGYRL